MEMVGQEVEHALYGQGRIVQNEDNRIEVNFPGTDESKKFMYPEAFEKFLSMSNPESQKRVLKDVEAMQQERLAKKERVELEEQQRQEERAAAKTKKPAARKPAAKKAPAKSKKAESETPAT
ncbi:hypothetical protein [Saccharibacillus deserti]|uniref:hypothetical protein n=1 Tax=Saccharibacillus deserti TaxID=1634444 RepID=UPI001555142E|nr:hypothetical protein [Saccharibacillus deserti]